VSGAAPAGLKTNLLGLMVEVISGISCGKMVARPDSAAGPRVHFNLALIAAGLN
jgi:hypothetical protein